MNIVLCLIKPQFEAGREKVGKKGVVRDPDVHAEVIQKIVDFCLTAGYSVVDLTYSPITGPQGNIEYLIYIKHDDEAKMINNININDLVNEAKNVLTNPS